MPRSGAGTSYSSDYGLTDLNQITPTNPVDSWSALFRESTQTTLGRSIFDRFRVDHPGSLGQSQQTMSIEEANNQYGLAIKPTQTNRISVDLAQELGRKATQSKLDQSTIRQAQPDIIQSMGVGLAASATDPLEGLINLIPYGGPAFNGAASLARGVRLAGTARALTRAAALAEKPFLRGAIEGLASTALSSPFVAANSQALGREYDYDDAVMDIAVGGVAGSLLQGVPSLFRKRGMASSLDSLPIDREAALGKASLDFQNGQPVTIEKSIDAQQTFADVTKARQDITSEILKTRETRPAPIDETGTQRVYGEGIPVGERQIDDVPPEVIDSPTFQKHGTALEKRLLQFTEPDEFRATVGQHVENISLKMAKLADMFSLPKDDFLEVASDVATLQNELLSDVAHINDLLPADQQIAGDIKTTSAGLFRKDSLKALGAKINALNEMALQPIDDAAKITGITKEFDRLRKELKQANQYFAQAQAKGGDTGGKWQQKIAELTPQVQHAQNLLRGLGENPQAPELTLKTFLDSVGADLSPALEKLLAEAPETGELPVYRVRNQIFDNIMRRLDATEQYLKGSEEFGAVTPSRFPENDQILADVRKELAELGDVVDVDKFHEELFAATNKMISDQKALGIFDEKSLKRFDAIEEQFKANVEKTEAVKKGAVQAQACALRGVSE